MRKLILLMALFVNAMVYGQTAIQEQKIFDNIYVGIEGGASTPLNFNSVFPVNPVAGLKFGKEFTPIFGAEVEGQVFFNDNNVGRWTNTFVKGTNVSLNGTINLHNVIWGYKPRVFEVKTNTGIGWLHNWSSNNNLSAKTALDAIFNINDAHSVVITPGVWWNLNETGKVQFNKTYAQLGIFAAYIYHFKTSNGTHTFKAYDISALNNEINALRNELTKKPKEVVRPIVRKEVVYINPTTYVFFAKGSSELSQEAKVALDNIKGSVDIIATSSPEGSAEFNQKLSEERADAVAIYLQNKGVNINSCVGAGVQGEASNRVAIITSK